MDVEMNIIDPGSSIPKYLQIRNWLRGMVEAGRFEEGERLPSEIELAKTCGVNRNTLRQAISELATEGVLRRVKGVGTFVESFPTVELRHDTRKISSFRDDFGSRPILDRTEIIETSTIVATQEIAESLILGERRQVVAIKRLRIGNDTPLIYEENFLPHTLFKNILECDLSGSLYKLITARFGIKLVRSLQEIKAINFDSRISAFFDLPEQSAGFFMKNTTFDENNVPVDLMYSYFRGDKYKLELELEEY